MPEIQVNGRRVGYEVRPVEFHKADLSVVFIHGSGGDREDWRPQLENLSDAATLIAVELPGHGTSEAHGETSVPAFSRCVMDFVAALGLEKVVLAGCSLGSAITQWIALFAAPPWLKGIVLVGAGARLRVHPDFLEGLIADEDTARRLLASFCLSGTPDAALLGKLEEKYMRTPAELIHGDLSACNEFDVMDRIGEIRLPTLIVVGEDDKLTPVKYSTHLNNAIHGSRMAVLPRAGHLVMMEQPEQFNAVLRSFLDSLER
ncbi:MAG TPA: alpha/beta fold hydrolase [Desulfomonilaceae bacterium]|nr:alpha/beta fold hydrolase [Desulfomonilaceae bacterium]